MTWQILEVEPAHAVCDQCKRHDCGIVDGQHKWVRTGIVDEYGDHIVIGHGCVNAWAENMGISLETVTNETVRPPTVEEIGEAVINWGHFKWGEAQYATDSNPSDFVPPDSSLTAGQQTDTGTQASETGGSGTKRTRRATVRQQGNVRPRQTNRQGKHTEGAKDSD